MIIKLIPSRIGVGLAERMLKRAEAALKRKPDATMLVIAPAVLHKRWQDLLFTPKTKSPVEPVLVTPQRYMKNLDNLAFDLILVDELGGPQTKLMAALHKGVPPAWVRLSPQYLLPVLSSLLGAEIEML